MRACLLDKGSEDIQVLPNGLALITSVSSGAFCFSSSSNDTTTHSDHDDNRIKCQFNRRQRR